MSSVVVPMPVPRHAAQDDARVEWLQRHVAANRFLPVPPSERQFVGDGDFREIGAEFLGHFIRIGGLAPHERVLDIGCGLGRMAVPLTQYLAPDRRIYDGVDVVADGIDWCAEAITPVYPNFRFRHLDHFHPLYNQGGAKLSAPLRLPFEDGSFDFIILTSVLTHLLRDETAAYAREIRRLLAPGGRCFATLFLINDEVRRHLAQPGAARLTFDPTAEGPEFFADGANPTAAVAFDEAFLLGLAAEAGLRPIGGLRYGGWCGRRPASHYQDISLFGADI